MINFYYAGTAAVLVVYDVGNLHSFKKIKSWVDTFRVAIKEREPDRVHKCLYYVIGNKSELDADNGRKVPYLKGHQWVLDYIDF